MCKTKGGLTRHIRVKHAEIQTKNEQSLRFKGRKVDAGCFRSLLYLSLEKIKQDKTQTEEVLSELESVVFSQDDITRAYNVVEKLILSFQLNGNGETFYPTFYNCVSKNHSKMFPSLSRDSSLSL